MSVAAALSVAAAFAGVPDVAIAWYDVAGATPAAVRASLDARRPTDPNDRARVDALTRWSISWQWLGSPADPCGLSHATVSFAASVQLPRLTTRVAPELRRDWDRYVAALARHEAKHVRAAYAARAEVLAALRGATCATANAAGDAVLAAIHADAKALDQATDHGRSEGARFP